MKKVDRRGRIPCANCGMKGGPCCNGKGWIPVILAPNSVVDEQKPKVVKR